MDLNGYLIQLGIGTASGVLSGAINTLLARGSFSKSELVETLRELKVNEADIKAENIIQFLAKEGKIAITRSNIHSGNAINMQSAKGTSLLFGEGSTSSTPKTRIQVGNGAYIQANGGAGVRQNEDGSIEIYT